MAEFKYYNVKKAHEYTEETEKVIDFVYNAKGFTVPSLQEKFGLSYVVARDYVTMLAELGAVKSVDELTFEQCFNDEVMKKIKELSEKPEKSARKRRYSFFSDDDEPKQSPYADFYEKLKQLFQKYVDFKDTTETVECVKDIIGTIAQNVESTYYKEDGFMIERVNEFRTFFKECIGGYVEQRLVAIKHFTPRSISQLHVRDLEDFLMKNDDSRKEFLKATFEFFDSFFSNIEKLLPKKAAELSNTQKQFEEKAQGIFEILENDKDLFKEIFDKTLSYIVDLAINISKAPKEKNVDPNLMLIGADLPGMRKDIFDDDDAYDDDEDNDDDADDDDADDDEDEEDEEDEEDLDDMLDDILKRLDKSNEGEDEDDSADEEEDDEDEDNNDLDDTDDANDDMKEADDSDDKDEDKESDLSPLAKRFAELKKKMDVDTVKIGMPQPRVPSIGGRDYIVMLEELKRTYRLSYSRVLKHVCGTKQFDPRDFDIMKIMKKGKCEIEDRLIVVHKENAIPSNVMTQIEEDRQFFVLSNIKEVCNEEYVRDFEEYRTCLEVRNDLLNQVNYHPYVPQNFGKYSLKSAELAFNSIKEVASVPENFDEKVENIVTDYIKKDDLVDAERLKVFYYELVRHIYLSVRILFARRRLFDVVDKLFKDTISDKPDEEINDYIAKLKQ